MGQKWIFGAFGTNHVRYRDKCEIVCPNSPILSQSTPVNARICQGALHYPMWNLEGLLTVPKWAETHPRSLDLQEQKFKVQSEPFKKLRSGKYLPSDGVDWDCGGELGRRARARKDILSLCLSQLKPHFPIHLHCPDPPCWTVISLRNCSLNFI